MIFYGIGVPQWFLFSYIILKSYLSGWWFGTWILWRSICWECHHPNWRFFFSEGLKPPNRMGHLPVIKGGLKNPWIDDCPNRTFTYRWFSIATFDDQRDIKIDTSSCYFSSSWLYLPIIRKIRILWVLTINNRTDATSSSRGMLKHCDQPGSWKKLPEDSTNAPLLTSQ